MGGLSGCTWLHCIRYCEAQHLFREALHTIPIPAAVCASDLFIFFLASARDNYSAHFQRRIMKMQGVKSKNFVYLHSQ